MGQLLPAGMLFRRKKLEKRNVKTFNPYSVNSNSTDAIYSLAAYKLCI